MKNINLTQVICFAFIASTIFFGVIIVYKVQRSYFQQGYKEALASTDCMYQKLPIKPVGGKSLLDEYKVCRSLAYNAEQELKKCRESLTNQEQ